MIDQSSKRRKVENEVIFREYNESVEKKFKSLKEMAKKEGQEEFIKEKDIPLHFYCECSDIECKKRVIVKPSIYKKIHENRSKFIIICGHEIEEIEYVLDKTDEYCVIEKREKAPESIDDIDNE
jgi:hypothetical protein